MALGDVITSGNAPLSTMGTSTVSLSAPATAGNLIVLGWSRNGFNAGVTPVLPAGMIMGKAMSDIPGQGQMAAVCWKKAVGGEQVFLPSWTSTTQPGMAVVAEYDATGLDLDTDPISTQDTSTAGVAALTVASGNEDVLGLPSLAIAMFCPDNSAPTYVEELTNGYVRSVRNSITAAAAQCQLAALVPVATGSTGTVGTLRTTGGAAVSETAWGALLIFGPSVAAVPTIDNVDGDNIVNVAQNNVVVNGSMLTGTTTFTITKGSRSINCNIDSVTDTQLIVDIPPGSSIIAANVPFGSCTFSTNTGASIEGTLLPSSTQQYMDITDVSQAAVAGCLWNGQSPAVAPGDQVRLPINTVTHGWPLRLAIDGFFDINSSASGDVDTFWYYLWDASDETWGAEGTITVNPAGTSNPPTLVSPIPDQNVDTNDVVNLSIVANFSDATSYVASPLPAGITFNGISGVFTGTATTPGAVATTVTAQNQYGSVPDTFTWNIVAVPTPPVLVNPIPDQIFINGEARNADLNNIFTGADSFSTTALPPGFSLVGDFITGTYTGGDSSGGVTVTATNAQGNTQDTFLWTGYAASPVPAFATLADAILIITGGPTVNDGLKRFYLDNSAGDATTLPGLELQYLVARGYTTGTVNDRWMAYLGAKGYSGTLNDRLCQWWLAGAPL